MKPRTDHFFLCLSTDIFQDIKCGFHDLKHDVSARIFPYNYLWFPLCYSYILILHAISLISHVDFLILHVIFMNFQVIFMISVLRDILTYLHEIITHLITRDIKYDFHEHSACNFHYTARDASFFEYLWVISM